MKPNPHDGLHSFTILHSTHRSDLVSLSVCVHRVDGSLKINDLYGLDHVDGWEPYDLRDLAHASWVGSVHHVYRQILHV